MNFSVETMNTVVQCYCNGRGCGEDCKISSICNPINGSFKDNPVQLEEAFNLLLDKSICKSATSDNVNHPSHYNREGAMETIDEMEVIFGTEATIEFCRLNAWKYRARANAKNGEEDIKKSDWYIRKAAELKTKLRMDGVYERRTENL